MVTSTIVMEGDGRIGEYVGGYSDWLRQRPQAATGATPSAPFGAAQPRQAAPVPAAPRRKLGFKEQRELEELPQRIEALEARIAASTARMADPGYFQRDAAAITSDNDELAQAQAALDAGYARWQELDAG